MASSLQRWPIAFVNFLFELVPCLGLQTRQLFLAPLPTRRTLLVPVLMQAFLNPFCSLDDTISLPTLRSLSLHFVRQCFGMISDINSQKFHALGHSNSFISLQNLKIPHSRYFFDSENCNL